MPDNNNPNTTGQNPQPPPASPQSNQTPYGQDYEDFLESQEKPQSTPQPAGPVTADYPQTNPEPETPYGANYGSPPTPFSQPNIGAPPTFNEMMAEQLETTDSEPTFEDEESDTDDEDDEEDEMPVIDETEDEEDAVENAKQMTVQMAKEQAKKAVKKMIMKRIIMVVAPTCLTILGWGILIVIIIIIVLLPILEILSWFNIV